MSSAQVVETAEDATVHSTAIATSTNGALVEEQQRGAGISALARMSEPEFQTRLAELRVGMDRFKLLMKETLTTGPNPGDDLMIIPGINKPVFTLSGAEKTAFIARLVPTFLVQSNRAAPAEAELERALGATPVVSYIVRTQLHLGNADGPVIAEGIGSCNSHEVKYRYRTAERKCPACGAATIFESKFEKDKGAFKGTKPFFCWKNKGGCGAEFAHDDVKITEQFRGRIDNPDPFDLDNTILKMAKKRSFVDGVKTATCASGMVTQDLEENAPATPKPPADPTLEIRDRILNRARKLEWKKLGEIFHVVRVATGKTIGIKAQFDKLPMDDLEKVWEHMPIPADELADAADEDIAAHTSEGVDVTPTGDAPQEDLPL